MENLWEMIAKARGVEINEVFKWQGSKYKITNYEGLLVLEDGWVKSRSVLSFIRGGDDCVIERLPFRPQIGGEYYTIILNKDATSYKWYGDTSDYARLVLGLVFRTREEAEAYIPIWQEIISKL